MNRWVAGSHTSPLPAHGPNGVSQVVAGFNQAYAQDSIHRYNHHINSVANLSGSGLIASSHQVPELGQKTVVYDKSGLTMEMFAVDHQPISPATGYLFTFKGRTVLISGDTIKSANVELFSKQVDLLVHEALSNELLSVMSQSAERAGNTPLSKIFYDVLDYHTSPTEVAEIAQDADVGRLLYCHIVPSLDLPRLEGIWLDGTRFTLPENSTDIIKVNSRM
jgi:ribonuclease Z